MSDDSSVRRRTSHVRGTHPSSTACCRRTTPRAWAAVPTPSGLPPAGAARGRRGRRRPRLHAGAVRCAGHRPRRSGGDRLRRRAGVLLYVAGRPAVTRKLSVEYLEPVLLGRALRGAGAASTCATGASWVSVHAAPTRTASRCCAGAGCSSAVGDRALRPCALRPGHRRGRADRTPAQSAASRCQPCGPTSPTSTLVPCLGAVDDGAALLRARRADRRRFVRWPTTTALPSSGLALSSVRSRSRMRSLPAPSAAGASSPASRGQRAEASSAVCDRAAVGARPAPGRPARRGRAGASPSARACLPPGAWRWSARCAAQSPGAGPGS